MPIRSQADPKRCTLWLVVALVAAVASFSMPAGAAPDPAAAVVSTSAGSGPETHATGSSIEEGQLVTTGAAENLALVLQDNALLELCSRSVITLRRHAVRRAQIVKLDAGEARFVVSPRSPDERIEVHTPSAIATILGTVVMVKVDPVTGETTVTSEENAVEVRSSDPTITGTTKVMKGERCVVANGNAPSDAEKLGEESFASLGDCLLDLENAALAKDRVARRKRDIEKIAMADLSEIDLPTVAALGGGPDLLGPSESDTPIDPTSAKRTIPMEEMPPEMMEMPAPPPPCMVLACMPGSNR